MQILFLIKDNNWILYFLRWELSDMGEKKTKCGCKINLEGSMKLYCDNRSKIDVAHNPIKQDNIKHIEVDGHFIKGKLNEGLVCMSYIPSQQQVAVVIKKRTQ